MTSDPGIILPPPFDEDAARAWCMALCRTLTKEAILRNGRPYLWRYFAAGWAPTRRGVKLKGPAVFLHHFVASDPGDQVHSHPWGWSASLILVGGYREHRCTASGERIDREYRPGDVNVLLPDDRHRIDLLGADCWSLFLAGDFAQPWQFFPTC